MTGLGFLGLTLISMGWLFFLAGLVSNVQAMRRSRPGVPLLPGLVGSVTVFFSLPPLIQRGVDVPWPWLWILLPLVVDPGCLPGLLRRLRK
jgi:hypothetical protein